MADSASGSATQPSGFLLARMRHMRTRFSGDVGFRAIASPLRPVAAADHARSIPNADELVEIFGARRLERRMRDRKIGKPGVVADYQTEAVVLVSCSHKSPEGNLSVFVGRHGAMKPAGRVRCNMWAK
jgi:hypothetical protein